MGNILLVGTVHTDFKGPERIMKILRYYNNPVIAIESTEQEAEDARQKLAKHRRSIENVINISRKSFTPAQISALNAWVDSYSYESNVPYNFQRENPNALVAPIGTNIENLDKWVDYKVREYIANGGDVSKLTGFDDPKINDLIKNGLEFHQKAIDRTYCQDDSSFMRNLMGEVFPFLSYKKDELFAKRIRQLRDDHVDRELIGFFGRMHIFGDYEGNLYDQLSDLKPVRFNLIEADKI